MRKIDLNHVWTLDYRLITSVIVEVAPALRELGLECKELFLLAELDTHPHPAALAEALDTPDRRVLFDILFDTGGASTWEEAESCLSVMRRRRVEDELATVQRDIEARPSGNDLNRLLARKQELRRLLSEHSA